jgi:predicted lipid-binding transport protein (Tim44 family)
MGAGGFPIDLVLFGMIAAFLVLRLRSILGKKTGLEASQGPARPANRPAGPVIDAVAEPPVVPGHKIPDPSSPIGQTLTRMARVDANFTPQRFLGGAEAAFVLIVSKFAGGDRDALRPLLSPETYASFEAAITAREQAGESQTSEVRAIPEASIEAASLTGTVAEITVRFTSDQVNQVLDRDGRHVSGTDAVTELHDEWLFGRDLSKSDPAWRLLQARTAA